MKKLIALMMALAFCTLAGCNTMEGLGKDIKSGGEKLEGSAKETRESP